MVSSEASPWAKSGGLADVLGALPAALARLGHPVATVIPRYSVTKKAPATRAFRGLRIPLAGRIYEVDIWKLTAAEGATGRETLFLVDQPELFDRPGLYGDAGGDYGDNHIRFALLSKAALEISRRVFPADIIHCHDWQASLVPAYLKDPRMVDPAWLGIRTLLTIHNLGYQGVFDRSILGAIGLPAEFDTAGGVEFWGRLSLLKAGVVFADALNTVSKKYAEEIQTPEYGFGMDGLLRDRRSVLSGILNGADYSQWNPETDPYLPGHYSAIDLSGKQICKRELLREMGLPERAIDRPLLAVISRFAQQKGLELIAEVAPALFEDDVYLVVLGNGEAWLEDLFRTLQAQFPDRISVRFGYDDRLAHRIEAGADIFLMPSRYEPCGLNQIYSLRYGTVPVVRATGGLDDTIVGAPASSATGFKFPDYNGNALLETIRQACGKWTGRKAWAAMMVRGMQKDFSWTASAGEYSQLYRRIASSGAVSDSNF
jgi:starch synthase